MRSTTPKEYLHQIKFDMENCKYKFLSLDLCHIMVLIAIGFRYVKFKEPNIRYACILQDSRSKNEEI